MVTRTDSATLSPLEQRILEHTGRYRISYAPLMARLLNQGQSVDAALQALRKDNLLATVRPSQTDHTVYHLTLKGTRITGVPKDRAEVLKRASALDSAFRMLCFCCLSEPRRSRMDQSHVHQLLGGDVDTKNRFYCIGTGSEANVYRVHLPSDRSSDKAAFNAIRDDFAAAASSPLIAPLLKARRYANIILVTKESRAKRIRLLLRAHDISQLGRVELHVAPGWLERQPFLKEKFSNG